MFGVAIWVAYIKGWIFADFKTVTAKEALNLIDKGELPLLMLDQKRIIKNPILEVLSLYLMRRLRVTLIG